MNNKVAMVARLLLGLIFFVFGLNGFFQFIPIQPMPAAVTAFMAGVMVAPYFIPLLALCETVGGALLLTNKQVPLGLLILAPLCVQITFFHIYLTPGIENLIMPVVLLSCGIITAKAHWHKFKPLFS